MRQDQQLLAGVLAVAVLTLLYFGLSRQPTRVKPDGTRPAAASQPRTPPGSAGNTDRRDTSQELMSTELYTMRQVNASLRHNDVPLRLSLVAVEPRHHIEPRVPPVLLLHGHEQSAMMWEKIGTLQALGENAHRAYAVDLPGSGNTRLLGKLAHSDFIQSVIDYLDLDRPLLVAPSTSGVYAFAYVFDDPSSIRRRLSGFVGFSPSHALAYVPEEFSFFKKVYTALVYGSEDDLPGEEAYKRFRTVPSARIVAVPSAGHMHYMERPDIVNEIILDALKALGD